MSEWLKEHAWKACVGETLPWVRIPLSPPAFAKRSLLRLAGCVRPGVARGCCTQARTAEVDVASPAITAPRSRGPGHLVLTGPRPVRSPRPQTRIESSHHL